MSKTIAALNKQLDDAVLTGKAMEAFEELYAEDVVMQENSEPVHRGKALNRKREQEFFATVEAFHGGAVLASAANEQDGTSFSEWEMDVTLKGVGRVKMAQVAVRRWRDGKLVAERFYHN
jgi:hypothetical protein